MFNHWIQLWPAWANRPWGMIMRICVAGTGLVWGATWIYIAIIFADQPHQPGPLPAILASGSLMIVIAVATAVFPSRLTFFVLVLISVIALGPVLAG